MIEFSAAENDSMGSIYFQTDKEVKPVQVRSKAVRSPTSQEDKHVVTTHKIEVQDIKLNSNLGNNREIYSTFSHMKPWSPQNDTTTNQH